MQRSVTHDLSHLSDAKRAILTRRLKGRADRGDRDESSVPTELIELPEARHAPYPVRDYVRERLSYRRNRANDFRLFLETRKKGLDPVRFAAAWRRLHANVDAMRARIVDGEMVVAPAAHDFDLLVLDVRRRPAPERDRIIEDARARFEAVGSSDTDRAVEIGLVRTGDDEFACLFSFDLLILDLVSIELLALRCRRVYESNDPAEQRFYLPDYRRTEDAYLASSHGQAARRYWNGRIARMGPRLSASALRNSAPPGRGNGYLKHSVSQDVWRAGQRFAGARGVSELTAVRVLFTDLLAHLSGQSEFAYETRLFQRLPFHRDINDLLGQFSLGHLTGRSSDAPRSFAERVRAEQEQTLRNAQFGFFDAATHWSASEPGHSRGGKIVFTNTCIRFQQFVVAGNVPPMHWLGEYTNIVQRNPDTALEYVLVENAGNLESHWFLNHAEIAPSDAEAAHRLLVSGLYRLCTDDSAWDAESLLSATDSGVRGK